MFVFLGSWRVRALKGESVRVSRAGAVGASQQEMLKRVVLLFLAIGFSSSFGAGDEREAL
jgi:hypothetical protein